MNETQSIRRSSVGSYATKVRIKEIVIYLLLVIFIGTIFALTIKIYLLKQIEDAKASGLYRTEKAMINGGKRFIDGYFSINAATVRFDQYRAMDMMIDENLVNKRLRYLSKEDIFRKTEKAGSSSNIQWGTATNKIQEWDGKKARIHYVAYLNVDDSVLKPIDIVLYLEPVLVTDKNTEGVGVIKWVNKANKPFEVTND